MGLTLRDRAANSAALTPALAGHRIRSYFAGGRKPTPEANTIGSLLEKHRGNVPGFNAVRFFAASAVLLSHSFGAAENREFEEPLRYLTSKLNLGNLAVFIFFLLSGFVITQSCLKSKSSGFYLLKRAARIMPGLILVTVFCALFIGPLVTSFSLAQYFRDPKFYKFFLNCLFVFRGELPGAFEHNPSGDYVNISLWTLRYEALCYVVILLVIVLTKRFSSLLVAGLAAGLVILAYPTYSAFVTEELQHLRSTISLKLDIPYIFSQGMSVIPFFFVGSLFYYGRDRIPISFASFVASVATMVAIILYGEIFPLFPFALGYAIIYLAFCNNPVFDRFKKSDYSYGIYIFAFPIQQTVVTFFSTGMTWWANVLLAYPIVLCLAALSWHFVERPSLHYARGLEKRMVAHRNARLGAPESLP
jgi:peptidoglycan/LPS O-acetylase OafA/YrhL